MAPSAGLTKIAEPVGEGLLCLGLSQVGSVRFPEKVGEGLARGVFLCMGSSAMADTSRGGP